jgi:hypothetical protein
MFQDDVSKPSSLTRWYFTARLGALLFLAGCAVAEDRGDTVGVDLAVAELVAEPGALRLVLDAFNPMRSPRSGILIRLPCRTAAGGTATLLAIATTSAELGRARRIAREQGGATILIHDRGFPGGEQVRLAFRLPTPAPLAAESCGPPELRGIW